MAAHAAPAAPGLFRVAVPYVRPERGRLAVAAGAETVQIGCQLLSPWPLALAVDHALGGLPLRGPAEVFSGFSSTGLLVVSAVATVLLTALAGLLDVCSIALAEGAAERIGGALRAAVFERTLTLSLR